MKKAKRTFIDRWVECRVRTIRSRYSDPSDVETENTLWERMTPAEREMAAQLIRSEMRYL